MDKETAPIGKCYKCGADLYATLGLCDSCRCVELEIENKQLKASLKIAVGYIKNPGSRTLEGQLKDIETGHY